MQKIKWKSILGWTVAAIVAVFIIFSNIYQSQHAASKNGKDTIKIGIIYPLTGATSFFGTGAKNAVSIFQENLNKMDLKHNYEFIFEDSQAQASIGLTAAMKLINLNQVDVIVDNFSGVAIAVSNLTEKEKIPHFSYAQNKDISKGFYNWRVVTSEIRMGEALWKELKKRGMKDIVVIRKNAEGPVSNYNGFKPFLDKDSDIKVRKIYDYNANERDFRIMLYKVKQDNPQAILLLSEKPDTDLLFKQMKEVDLNVPVASVFSLNYLDDKSLGEGAWHVNVAMPSQEWKDQYYERFKTENTNMAEHMYAILQMILTIYESENRKLTGEEVIQHLKGMDGLMTPVGPIIYDSENQNMDTPATIQEIRNGKLVLVEN